MSSSRASIQLNCKYRLNADYTHVCLAFVDRLNEAPVSGYKRDVGTKTTLRITYPEGAIQKPEIYEEDSLFVFSAFKPLDFKWLKQMVFKEKLTPKSHN
ncbi:CMP-N-acetylneuraminate-beta-1,4-galactoside alpha-2,3-sialyltransferase, partial [Xenotaenia resolanae]